MAMEINLNRQINLFEPGILNFPNDSRNWDGHACTWTNLNSDRESDRSDYFCTPVGRAFFQQRRINRFVNLVKQYQGKRTINAITHSNGAAIVLTGLQQDGWPQIGSLHLISGACEASFRKNGLNLALLHGRIEKVFVYVGGKDWALRLAALRPAQWLGYGHLGLHGPQDVEPSLLSDQRVKIVTMPDYGHSDWFTPANFNSSMEMFMS